MQVVKIGQRYTGARCKCIVEILSEKELNGNAKCFWIIDDHHNKFRQNSISECYVDNLILLPNQDKPV